MSEYASMSIDVNFDSDLKIDIEVSQDMVIEMSVSNAATGTKDYNNLANKPQINNSVFEGNNSITELRNSRIQQIWQSIFEE